MVKTVITLTTVPERLNQPVEDGFKLVIQSLCEQNNEDYEIHLNIPKIYSVTGEPYIIPDWLKSYCDKYEHLKLFETEDLGPPTKVVPTIQRVDGNTLIIVVDDDLVYHPEMVNEHIKHHQILPNSVILYDGRNLTSPKYGDLRDSWVLTVGEVLRVKELQHYKSASYFARYFEDDFFKDFLGQTKSDDVLMSYYFRFKKIKMFVVPYESEIEKVKTFEEWNMFQGVTTFPVIRHANSVMNTGCNHPNMLSNEPKFFIPQTFKFINNLPLD